MEKDYDFAFGFFLVCLAFVATIYNAYILIFVSREPITIIFTIVTAVWFLFAPVYIFKAIDMGQWTFSMCGNSVWSALRWRWYMKRHPEEFGDKE